ncbi:LysR family transcriptional regulator [Ectobacillus panaciterrae]|uniref:LysR family transcriptional regulator n=1 Tax=Ectobacillus panaciterrae TaxID=363872 RepID=UPI0003F51AF2|nr:LysR family transcriptional regulator [Ectobacillus panaciterrae]
MQDKDWIMLQVLYSKKNITKAADSLYISQPTLTNRIQQIEKEFGVKIINRGRRGVQFTPQGEYLAKCADEMLLKMQQMKETVLNMNHKVTGTLRLAVSNFFAQHKLPALLKLFKDQYPNVEFKITTGFSKDIMNVIYNGDIHIAFIRGDYSWQGPKRLLMEENICIASKEEINIKELPSLPRIDYYTDYSLKMLLDNWWRENYPQPPCTSIEVDRVETCKEMVMNGLGYAIVPSMILDEIETVHKIAIKNSEGKPILRKTWMLYSEESLEINIVKAFVHFIESIDLQDIM